MGGGERGNQQKKNFLVLGTGKYLKNGLINRYYRYRIEALFNAYKEGMVSLVVLSGGPDEVVDMEGDLISMGVDPSVLRCDPHGMRTYESFKHYRNMWGGAPLSVVTQRFHMVRSLGLAKRMGLRATPYYAKGVGGISGLKVHTREFFALGKMVFDLMKPVTPWSVPSKGITKKQLRRYLHDRIDQLGESYRSESSKVIVRRVIHSQEFQQAQQVLLFYPMENEVDLRSLMEECWNQGKQVALPKIDGDIMQFFLINRFEDLEMHPFGCMEPVSELPTVSTLQDSLLLIPGLAYDPTTAMRLGRGKGYYDRFIVKALREHKRIMLRMVLFQCQVLQGVPHDTWDIPIPSAVTEIDFYGEWE